MYRNGTPWPHRSGSDPAPQRKCMYLRRAFGKKQIPIGCFNLLFNNLANYATGEVVDDHMSTLSHKGFVVSIFKNLGKSSIYSLIESVISIFLGSPETKSRPLTSIF